MAMVGAYPAHAFILPTQDRPQVDTGWKKIPRQTKGNLAAQHRTRETKGMDMGLYGEDGTR